MQHRDGLVVGLLAPPAGRGRPEAEADLADGNVGVRDRCGISWTGLLRVRPPTLHGCERTGRFRGRLCARRRVDRAIFPRIPSAIRVLSRASARATCRRAAGAGARGAANRSSASSPISSASSCPASRTGTIRVSLRTLRSARRRSRSSPRRWPPTLDVNAMLWRTSPAATELEDVTMRWLGRLLGLPRRLDRASSTTPRRSAASRRSRRRAKRSIWTFANAAWPGATCRALRVYITEHTHSHVEKAAIALGVGRENVVRVAVRRSVSHAPGRAGRSASTTIVAAGHAADVRRRDRRHDVDDVDRSGGGDRRRRRERARVWLHVDAAYAGLAAIVPEFR